MKKVIHYKSFVLLAIVVLILWFVLVIEGKNMLMAIGIDGEYDVLLFESVLVLITSAGVVINGYYDRKKRDIFGQADYKVTYFRQPFIRVIYGLLSGMAIVAYTYTRINFTYPLYSLLGLSGVGLVATLYGRYYYNDQMMVVQNWVITIGEIDDISMVTNDFGRKLMFTAKNQKKAVDFVNGENQIRVYQWISGRLAEKEIKNGNLGITS